MITPLEEVERIIRRQIRLWLAVRDHLEWLIECIDGGDYSPHSLSDAVEVAEQLDDLADTIRKHLTRPRIGEPDEQQVPRLDEAPGRE
jgi:hypothetical protein